MVDETWDVVVVGCGPVGAFAANLFGKYGLRTLVLDREISPFALPRAVHIDHEIVRLFADIGLCERILDGIRAGDGHIHIGADGGVIRYLSATENAQPYGYANDYFFYQPELESELRDGLARYPDVELRLGEAVTSIDQDEGGVSVELGSGGFVRARWVVGCDGARSIVRKTLGIRLDDLDFDEPWLVVDAEVEGSISFPAFSQVPPSANLQNLSLMMCDPNRPATIVPGRGNHRRWEFMLLPGEDVRAMAEPDVVADLIRPWVVGAPHRIVRAATYRFHGLVAEQWRKGRVFLAGDSAHQTPPFFGQGMCHGLRDAANLAWKLALVLSGTADERLLDTYQIEREGQVRHVISAAIEAGRYICELDPYKAAQRDVRIRSEKGIRTASELIAPIASAIVSEGAGQRFINPPLGGGKLLDDVTGGGWVLIEAEPIVPDGRARRALDALGAKRFDLSKDLADNVMIGEWLEMHGAAAVLLRPDFYAAATGASAAEFSARLKHLFANMHLAEDFQAVE